MTRMLVGSVTERAIKLTSVGGKVKTVEKEEVTKVKVKARTREVRRVRKVKVNPLAAGSALRQIRRRETRKAQIGCLPCIANSIISLASVRFLAARFHMLVRTEAKN